MTLIRTILTSRPLFQFHKVQLKELESILLPLDITFQFHKVQLKVQHLDKGGDSN